MYIGRKRILGWLFKSLVLVAILWAVFVLAGRVLTRVALSQIAELTNTTIKTGSVDFGLNGSVSIQKLVIKPDKSPGHNDTILKAETVFARFSKGSLLLLRPRLREISVNDFVFNAQYDLDAERWNISAIERRASGGGRRKMPVVRLEKGVLQYSNVSKGQSELITAVPIDVRFSRTPETRDSYSFDITAGGNKDFGESFLRGTWQSGKITVEGKLASADIPAFERVWSLRSLDGVLSYDREKNYSLALRVSDFVGKPKPAGDTFAIDRMPFTSNTKVFAALHRFFNQYSLLGRLDINLEASGNFEQLDKSKVEGGIHCKDISICNSLFPYPVEGLAGQIDFTENRVLFKDLNGRHKDVKLVIGGAFEDFGPNLKGQLKITSDNMALDEDLYHALDEKQKQLWTDFSPSGVVTVDYIMNQDPKTASGYTLNVELLDVNGKYTEFPYPLENVTGHLFFDQNSIDVQDFLSQVGERRITAQGRITATDTNEPQFDLLIEASNVPLDSTLAGALADPQRDLYNQFEFDGQGDGKIKVFSLPEDPREATFTADLSFKDISIGMKRLPVTISEISAKTIFTPELISFESFTGRSWDGSVSLTGQIWPGVESEQLSYDLSLKTTGAELNESLIGILPGAIKNLATKLQPKGKVNFVADLKKVPEDEQPDYEVVVECLANSVGSGFVREPPNEVPGDSERFFYPLKDIMGHLTITKDKISLSDITATAANDAQTTPNAPTIEVAGEIAFADNAFKNGVFTVCANDIGFDENLRAALPKDIRGLYQRLSPTGRFDLDFEKIGIFNAADGQRNLDLAGAIRFKGCRLDVPGQIDDLDAVLKIEGLRKKGPRLSRARATFDADRLRMKGTSLTGLRADIDYDPSQRNWLAKSLVAHLHGGPVAGKLQFRQPADRPLEYLLQVGFEDIDLEEFLSEISPKGTPGNGYTIGKVAGTLSLIQQDGGAAGHNYPRIGRCRLQITDMQAGKASLFAKLLSVMKLTEPKDFAFERMLVDSYVKDSTVFFEQLDISGQAVAFSGKGSMELPTLNLNLTLFARGDRLATAEPSLIQSLTDGLGQAVVRIDVTGSVYEPEITKTTLPILKVPLGILGTKPDKPD